MTYLSGARVLDVGVGDGIYFTNPKVVSLIKEKNFKIYGIDIDEGVLLIVAHMICVGQLCGN